MLGCLLLGCGGSPAPGAPRATGAALYGKLCALCHGALGQGGVVEGAPALNNQDLLASATDEFLFTTIANGRPGTRMGAWGTRHGGPLDDGEVDLLIAFIERWRTVPRAQIGDTPVEGSAKRGAALYAATCASCHGAEGEGGVGPSLANPGFLRAASDGFIRYTIANGRRGTAMSAYDEKLTAQQIDDLTAFIRGWAD